MQPVTALSTKGRLKDFFALFFKDLHLIFLKTPTRGHFLCPRSYREKAEWLRASMGRVPL